MYITTLQLGKGNYSVSEETEASYQTPVWVMDSREGGPEESNSELEEGIGEGIGEEIGGEVLGKPLPKHLGQDTGQHKGEQRKP